MAGDQYVVMQGTIQQATLHDKLQSCNLSRGCFKKYFNNGSGDIVMMFDGCETSILSPIIMFFGKPFSTNRVHGDRSSSCYCQASRLVKCAYKVVSLYLLRSFMSCHYENYKDAPIISVVCTAVNCQAPQDDGELHHCVG